MCNLILVIIINVTIFSNRKILGQAERKFLPNLPLGEYQIKFRAGFKCNTTFKYEIDFNMHQNKISRSTTTLTGNMDLQIPLDDSLTIDMNGAILDKIGGWKDNAFVYQHSNACTTALTFMGPVGWKMLLDSFNATDYACPIKANFYTMYLDVNSLANMAKNSNTLVPKSFFYGSYKFKMILKNQIGNKIVGCFIAIIDIIRPWEDTYHYQ